MDQAIHEKIVTLETLMLSVCNAVHENTEAINSLRKEFYDLKEEQRVQAKTTNNLLEQFGTRISSV